MTTAMTTDPITDLSAQALSQAIHARRLSCRAVMGAYLARIHRLNPALNAIVNLADDDVLLAQADARDAELARGQSRGWMHGMPQAIKDVTHAAGFPTTLGLPALARATAREDGLVSARMKAAGCIVIGKTNVPEFGLGSHTYNTLFGATPNAWDATVSAGGSSGGAAVCLAQRLLPVADGSDVMGSLRNPAGWNHVFGLRPSFGRVPRWPAADVYLNQLGSEGPMARSVADLAQLLAVQAGHDPRVPHSLATPPGTSFMPPANATAHGLRVAWLGDLGGYLAMEGGVLAVCEAALEHLSNAGAQVESSALGIDPARLWQPWLTWRQMLTAQSMAPVMALPGARAQLKPEALWEFDAAQGLSVATLTAASVERSAFLQHLLTLFERFDVLALPSAQVWPFPVEQHWPRQIAGRAMDTYHRWMEVTLYATFAGLPAISLPAGFDPSGRWPMGLQLIGRPQGDAALLAAAAAYEALVPELLARRPPEPARTRASPPGSA